MSSTSSLPFLRHGSAAALLVVVAACAAPGTTPTPAPTAVAATTNPAASVPASTAPPAASAVATTGVTGGSAQVDLTFSGTYPFTAKGTAGRCVVVTVAGATTFGFEGTDADYPGMGMSFSVAELSGRVDIKWIKDADTSWGIPPFAVIQTAPDHHSVSLDADLSPFTNTATGKTAGPEHVKGTITCP